MTSMTPRFSVVIPVRDRAETVGRAVAGVLTQTFGDLELVVVDDGSRDGTVAAVRAVGDDRVRILETGEVGATDACRVGLEESQGRWAVLLDADSEVAPGWLARLGRLADASGARFVSCGGQHHHGDGSTTDVEPTGVACLRPGAFAAPLGSLVDAALHVSGGIDPSGHSDPGGSDDVFAAISSVGRAALVHAIAAEPPEDGRSVVSTPEPLVAWHDPVDLAVPDGDGMRLHWANQVLDALSRTPIPDGDLLARAATVGGVAAARMGLHDRARLLFGIACRARPGVGRNWARWAVSCVPPISRRVWDRERAVAGGDEPDPGEGVDRIDLTGDVETIDLDAGARDEGAAPPTPSAQAAG